jgi:hypothetical protein
VGRIVEDSFLVPPRRLVVALELTQREAEQIVHVGMMDGFCKRQQLGGRFLVFAGIDLGPHRRQIRKIA